MKYNRNSLLVSLALLVVGALITFAMLYPATTGKVDDFTGLSFKVLSVLPILLTFSSLFGIYLSFKNPNATSYNPFVVTTNAF